MKNSIVQTLLGSSPKTTIAGYVKAILAFVITYIGTNGLNYKDPLFWLGMGYALLEAIKGRIQKDSNGITAKEAQAVIKPELAIIESEKGAGAN